LFLSSPSEAICFALTEISPVSQRELRLRSQQMTFSPAGEGENWKLGEEEEDNERVADEDEEEEASVSHRQMPNERLKGGRRNTAIKPSTHRRIDGEIDGEECEKHCRQDEEEDECARASECV